MGVACAWKRAHEKARAHGLEISRSTRDSSNFSCLGAFERAVKIRLLRRLSNTRARFY